MSESRNTSLLPFAMVILAVSSLLASYSRSVGTFGDRSYHADYRGPLRWFGVPNSGINEIRRVDAYDKTCGTMYHSPFFKTDNEGHPVDGGWTSYGVGFYASSVSEAAAKTLIDKNCY